MADPVTKEQVEAAEADFQTKVSVHSEATVAYVAAVQPFVSARKALLEAYTDEVQADATLTDLISRYQPEAVPPVPSDS